MQSKKSDLSDAVFSFSLATSAALAEYRLDPVVLSKVREGLAAIPTVVANHERLDDWSPLLRIVYGDTLSEQASKHLKRLLEGLDVKSEFRSNPWMMDMSKYLFVDVKSLVAAVIGGIK